MSRNQSELELLPDAREKASEQVSIGFSFASHWLRGWREFSKPIGHFRDAACLCFKTRPSAKPFFENYFFIILQIKLIFTSEGFWNSEITGPSQSVIKQNQIPDYLKKIPYFV